MSVHLHRMAQSRNTCVKMHIVKQHAAGRAGGEIVRGGIDDGVRQSAGLGKASPPEWPREAPEAIEEKDWHSAAALIAFPFSLPLTEPARDVTLIVQFFDVFGSRHTDRQP